MSIIQDKLGNEFLRSNGTVDSNFSSGMIMFSHLPPVTSFTRLAAHTVMQEHAPQDLILKKERDSPDCSMPGVLGFSGVGDYVHVTGIKQEKQSEHDYRLPLFPGALGTSAEILEVTVGNSQKLQVQDLNMGNLSSQLQKEAMGRKGRRSSSDGQEGKPRKRRNEAKHSVILDPDGGCLSPGTKPHICEHCSASFRSSYHLRRHVLIHTGERPFRCSQCSMSFIQKYLLQRHEKIHSGEKPFSCDQCNMRFIQKYHMERHKRTHSGEKPYRCETCQQYFSRTDRLLKHKRTCAEAIKKGLDPQIMDLGHGTYEQTQGTAGKKRARSKSSAGSGERRKKADGGRKESRGAEDDAESPTVSSSTEPGPGVQRGQASKMAFKKANRKSLDPGDLRQDGLGLMQDNDAKVGSTSSNYDDAMQFVKRRRYLQVSNAAASGPSVSGGGGYEVPPVLDGDVPLNLDKSGITDEVLQSLLEHYTQKPDGMQFDLELCASDTSAASLSGDKMGLMNEYSQFLLQALERTSHSASFSLGPPPPPITSSHNPLYADKNVYPSSPLECVFGQLATSSMPKSHFTMLTGSSSPHSFSLSALEASAHQQLTPSQELTEQMEKQQHASTPPSSYQIGPTDLSGQKEAVKSGPVAGFALVPSQDLTALDSAKSSYHIENFAQAFGSQFKSDARSLSYATDSGVEVDHRIRTPMSDFSGYSSLLSDVNEPGRAGSKIPTSQSYR